MMIETELYGGILNLTEARLCLDFANTADWHASEEPEEKLNRYSDLVSWAQEVGLITASEALTLNQEAAGRPVAAVEALQRAVDLREALYRIFSAVAAGRSIEPADLTLLNRWLLEASGQMQLAQTTDGFGWQWAAGEHPLEWMLWPVARSAADLLISEDLDRVKECADDRGCGWLFLDTSRNQSRRWCSMESCGNRAKVRRHRSKSAAA
jgi:predicted RNA-binding Zn ribbon-like protein